MADILLVEDEAPVREALSMALEDEGFSLLQASTAEAGLELLAREPVALLVTDFNLPGEHGGWLVREALSRGHYTKPSLMVTAAVRVPEIPGVEVLTKPLDLDAFIGKVRALVGGHAPPALRPQPLDLVLYLGRNAASLKAMQRVQQQLRLVPTSACALRVVQLGGGQETDADAERDRVTFAPTLVMRGPLTRSWAVGDAAIARNLESWLEAATEGTKRLAAIAGRG